ncbi:translation initiation factor IF-1 [Candidatus Cerribacteria bacterium 'Amazon FNV 2010 28 9']|uniref:Translation initiation factor IF-1 n=1 Tax=Candidatus Cerribacteria bacterium 'Amazon FNV 2010 28 9' TaxID=2081795 RepID=A0A317JPR0_9BACT|nr:MAG: translation initiation factor IF-1 [Candidatus Cerribacteria bacterium 'Amazon FNV 2010 28 9']
MQKLKQGEFEVEGEVLEVLGNMMCRIMVTSGKEELIGKELLGKVSGQMRMYKIWVMPGDKVKMVMTPYDATKGRITFRMK